jgi:S-adenosylmethionine-diacylglycerol 3-amino-3-carboxypropyl transferase
VREDPLIEISLAKKIKACNVFLIASGGCTAFSLKAVDPDLQITLLDPNTAQIDLIRNKIRLLRNRAKPAFKANFNIGLSDKVGLNDCGNFESLFRGLREFSYDLIMSRSSFEEFFEGKIENRKFVNTLLKSKYWYAAFDMFFCDTLLDSMFGPAATQHAQKGSYSVYFRKIIENGFLRSNAKNNYFLHHIFLGHYIDRKNSLPIYLQAPIRNLEFRFINSPIEKIKDFKDFDLVSLSNIMDWMPQNKITALIKTLNHTCNPGSAVIYRQLNNTSRLEKQFASDFKFDRKLSDQFLAADRSLFYSNISVGFRR